MEWKDINGFEGKYQISEDGRVRSIGRVVKNKCGTMTVNERILKPSGATPVILIELGIQFPTIEEAARFVNGKHSSIRRCLTGRNKTHRGFHFVRAEEGE